MLTKIEAEIYEIREKHQIPEIDTSNFKINLDKTVNFIQNVNEYWVNGSIDVKKKIQRLLFPI